MASLLIRGFLLGLAVAASPGPIFFLCLRRTLLRGWRVGFLSGLGVATADGFYAAIAVFGVAAVVALISGASRWLALSGGVALLALGVRSMIERPAMPGQQAPVTGRGLAWAYASTLGLTITNPATIISFAALAAALGAGLNGFINPAAVVLGVFAGSALWWAVLATLVTLLRARVAPFARAFALMSGLAIAVLGLAAIAFALGH